MLHPVPLGSTFVSIAQIRASDIKIWRNYDPDDWKQSIELLKEMIETIRIRSGSEKG